MVVGQIFFFSFFFQRGLIELYSSFLSPPPFTHFRVKRHCSRQWRRYKGGTFPFWLPMLEWPRTFFFLPSGRTDLYNVFSLSLFLGIDYRFGNPLSLLQRSGPPKKISPPPPLHSDFPLPLAWIYDKSTLSFFFGMIGDQPLYLVTLFQSLEDFFFPKIYLVCLSSHKKTVILPLIHSPPPYEIVRPPSFFPFSHDSGTPLSFFQITSEFIFLNIIYSPASLYVFVPPL